jgi:hypothetical protein
MMAFGENPRLEWKSGSIGSDGDEELVFKNDTASLLEFLPDDITEDTSVLITKIDFGSFDLFGHPLWNDGEGDDLRMRMLERSPCRNSVVFEDEDISKTLIPPQIDDPLAIGPQDILHCPQWHRRKSPAMLGRFDHHFMSPNAVHFVVKPLAFSA